MRIFFLVPFVFLSNQLFSQSGISHADKVIQIAQETSLYKDDVDWDKIVREYNEIKTSSKDNIKAYEYLLSALGDEHGAFRNSKTYQIIAYSHKRKVDHRAFNSKFIDEVINDVNARFSYKLVNPNIGYLKVVGIGPKYPMEEDARLIQDAIHSLSQSGVNKWILDLRYNGGGNMNPMLSGLSALIGDGYVGGSSDKSGKEIQNFKIQNNKFYDTGNLVIDIENPVEKTRPDRVVVLTSKYTASSGEILAVVFKGRKHTKFIGEKTKGLTTVTGFDRIDDETIMLISKAYYVDRNGNVYTDGVAVDEEVEFKEFEKFNFDMGIKKGIDWLQK